MRGIDFARQMGHLRCRRLGLRAGRGGDGSEEVLDEVIEMGEAFPAVDGVAFYANDCGGGGNGVALNEKAGGVLLAWGEGIDR